MSKEIIYLEPDEEITSIIDKIRDLQNIEDVFLVAPKGASISQSVVNLKILKKEADALGIKISMVSQDEIARHISSQVGLAVYESINATKPIIEPPKEEPKLDDVIEIDMSEKQSSKPPPGVKVNYYEPVESDTANKSIPTHSQASSISTQKYQPPIISKPKVQKKWMSKLAFALLGLLVFVILFYYFYPKAEVSLVIASEEIQENIEIVIDTSTNVVSDDNKHIPGEIITYKDEVSQEFVATGKKDVGEKAKGTVTLSNGAGTKVDVPRGTLIESTSGFVFVTTASASVPGATASVDSQGSVQKSPGTTDVSVEARDAGDKYNIGPTSFSVANFSNITAKNSTSFSGGISKQITVVSDDDIASAKEKLSQELGKKIKEYLNTHTIDKKLSFLGDSVEFYDSQFTTSHQSGSETQKFTAKLSQSAKTIAFIEEDYKKNIIAYLGDKIPDNKELVLSSDDEISRGDFHVDYSQGIMKIEGSIKTKLAPKMDYEKIKNDIKGKNIFTAEVDLKNNPSIVKAKIQMNPSWINAVPRRLSNIDIKSEYKNSNTSQD
jgi:hypothetical protein